MTAERIHLADLADRLREFAPTQFLYIHGIMKGIALGIGAIALVEVVGSSAFQVERVMFWLTSLIVISMTHSTVARGILLAGHRYNFLDTLFSLWLGVIECLLFVVLEPSEGGDCLWFYWYCVIALHEALAFGMIWNRLHQLLDEDFDGELLPLVQQYRRWVKFDRLGAGSMTLLCTAYGLAMWVFFDDTSRGTSYHAIYAIMISLIFIGVIIQSGRQRSIIQQYIRDARETSSGANSRV